MRISNSKRLQPFDEAKEVAADGGKDGIGGIALVMPEIIAARSVLGFDGGAPSQFTFDLRVIRRFWPEMNTLNL